MSQPSFKRAAVRTISTAFRRVVIGRVPGLFDAAYYLRTHLDVARRGEDPGVHFLRHWDHPFRKPSEAFDIAQYVLDHPEVRVERVNPLVHFLASAESDGAEAYPPATR